MRRPFGGTPDAYVINAAGKPLPGRDSGGNVLVEGFAYTDRDGGARVTDLADTAGTPLPTQSLIPDQLGGLEWLGPDDGTSVLWVDFGGGRRVKMVATDTAQRVASVEDLSGAFQGQGIITKGMPVHNVLAYGAIGSGLVSDTAALQAALNAARDGGGGTVLIPGGTYNVTATLRIYRNTHLIISPGAVLRRAANITMMVNGDAAQNFSGYTGHGNIRIDGGGVIDNQGTVWTSANNCLSFGHAENITVADITIKDESSYHGLEFNAVKTGRVIGVRFLGYVDNSGTGANFYKESIQIDLAKDSSYFPSFGPYDQKICVDIQVEGCTFGPSGTAGTTAPNSAMGGHSATVGVRHQGIRFVGNRCESLSFWAVSGYAFTGLVMANNHLSGCGAGLRTDTIDTGDPDDTFNTAGTQTSASQDERAVTITGNTILDTGTVGDAIRVYGEATGKTLGATVAGNVIDVGGSGTRGINCLYAERVTITGNSVYNVSGAGIYLDHCEDAAVTGNTVRASGSTGILVINSAGVTVGSNQVRSSGGDGIQVNNSTVFTVEGNVVRLAGNHGIDIITNCADFIVQGNFVHGASRTTAATSSAFRASATCTRGTWSGNRARRYGSGNEYLNGFSATATCSVFKRLLNNFQDGTTAGSAISDLSTSQDTTSADATAA